MSFLLVEEVVLAEQESGLTAVGDGDSGGPVFTLNSDSTKVYAAGMIIGGSNAFATACPRPGATGCTSRMAYVELRRVLGIHGLTLMTS